MARQSIRILVLALFAVLHLAVHPLLAATGCTGGAGEHGGCCCAVADAEEPAGCCGSESEPERDSPCNCEVAPDSEPSTTPELPRGPERPASFERAPAFVAAPFEALRARVRVRGTRDPVPGTPPPRHLVLGVFRL